MGGVPTARRKLLASNCDVWYALAAMKIVADRNIPFVRECFSSIGEVEVVAGRGVTAELVGGADVLLVRSVTKVNEELLAGSKVQFVATATIGTDHVDAGYLAKRGIGFTSAPGSNANSVAEYIVAALLEVAHKDDMTLAGKSIGVVGVGNVGSRVAKKCAALGMEVLLNDPPLRALTADAKYLPIEELYGCDFLTLHTPLRFEGMDKTYHLVDAGFFESLKEGCVFLNTSRGAVAETAAIKGAVESGKVRAVVLDVWENEPEIDVGLLGMIDIGTPHIAGYSYDGKVAGMIMIYEAVCEYFGLEKRFTVDSFLPEAAVPELRVEAGADEQEAVRRAVEKIYDIKADDARMREILECEAQQRGRFFSDLRKNYPVRREFQNTKVRGGSEGVRRILEGIGFEAANG